MEAALIEEIEHDGIVQKNSQLFRSGHNYMLIFRGFFFPLEIFPSFILCQISLPDFIRLSTKSRTWIYDSSGTLYIIQRTSKLLLQWLYAFHQEATQLYDRTMSKTVILRHLTNSKHPTRRFHVCHVCVCNCVDDRKLKIVPMVPIVL